MAKISVKPIFMVGIVLGAFVALASVRDDVLSNLRETASSKNYYWAWTCPWLHDGLPNGDDSRLVVWDGQVPRPKPTDSVKLETVYQKFAGGRRALINYADLYAVAGTWYSDRYYAVNRAGLTAAIKRQWKEFGGLQVFSWHMDQPYCTNGFEQASYRFKSSGENRNVIRQILDGTGGPCGTDIGGSTVRRKPYPTPRDWFMASLKDVADFFNGLVDDETGEKIPVVLRYSHESDGSWFWWGRGWCTTEEFRRFCRLEADYLRKTCGPDQIIFAYTPDVSWKDFGKEGDEENTFLAYYPGDKYVDIIGIDDYSIGNGDDRKVESNLNETIRKLRLMTEFAKERGLVVCISEAGGLKKRDDFWQWLHRAATADGVDVAFVDTWAWNYGTLPDTPASEADEKAFAARPEVLMEGKSSGFRAKSMPTAHTDDGVVFKGILIHNVMDLDKEPGGRYAFRRAGAAVHDYLSAMGKERNANNTGVELRFVLKGDAVTIRLGGKTDDAVSQILIHYGDILGDWPNGVRTVIGKNATITIPRVSSTWRSGDRFDPSVVRLVLPNGNLGIYDVTGNVEPPSVDLLPKSTYLAYGSSITHGGNAYTIEECYASLVGEGLGADVRNLGFAGCACMEQEMADFISEQKFDYATLEMGVNVVDSMGEDEYERRVRYFVDKVAGSHPKADILAIDIFGWTTGKTTDEKASRYRAILKRVVNELGHPNVSYVNGLDILPNDTEISPGAGVHPTPRGHRLMAERLLAHFRCR